MDHPGRGILFLGDETLAQLLDLPHGERVTGIATDFQRLGILLAIEADHFPPRTQGEQPVELLPSADITDTAAKVTRLETEIADLRSRLAAAENRDNLSPLHLVPVEVFGASCDTHCPDQDPDCRGSFGLCDAVQAWSDCNRAYGHLYRIDDTSRPENRRPGDTVEIFVRRADLPWFERRFGDAGGEPAARAAVTLDREDVERAWEVLAEAGVELYPHPREEGHDDRCRDLVRRAVEAALAREGHQDE